MSTPGFGDAIRAKNNPNERIEFGPNATLKKYGGTPTSWPTLTKVQPLGQPHWEQEKEVSRTERRIGEAFRSTFN